jgi:hypothetical protein
VLGFRAKSQGTEQLGVMVVVRRAYCCLDADLWLRVQHSRRREADSSF